MLNVLRWGPAVNASALVVMCHGVGADASQMAVFVDAWAPALPDLAFLAPDGPEPYDAWFGPDATERQWFSLRDRTPAVLEAGARAASPGLDAAIDEACMRLAVAPGRVVLAGFSQGAMMALYAGLRRRPAPLAILAYSGALLDTPALDAELSGAPPVLLVHGESDGVVPFARGVQTAAALQRRGLAVETCWRPGLEHSVDPVGLQAGAAMLARVTAPGAGMTNV